MENTLGGQQRIIGFFPKLENRGGKALHLLLQHLSFSLNKEKLTSCKIKKK